MQIAQQCRKESCCRKRNFIQQFLVYKSVPVCLDSHHVRRGQAKVGDDGGEGEEVAGTVVFMDPAAQVLQCCRKPLELLSQGQQQQQHVNEQEDRKLEDSWEQPADDKQHRRINITKANSVSFDWTMSASPYLGAGMRAWAAMRKRSMMKEQTRLELNISSLIRENWTNKRRSKEDHSHYLFGSMNSYPPNKNLLRQL